MPREPYQRCSQAIFEAWLKTKIDVHPLIESSWSVKLSDFKEGADGVSATLEDTKTGSSRVVKAQYLIGCDGGGSRVRRTLGLGLTGGTLSVSCSVTFRNRYISTDEDLGQQPCTSYISNRGIFLEYINKDNSGTFSLHPVAS